MLKGIRIGTLCLAVSAIAAAGCAEMPTEDGLDPTSGPTLRDIEIPEDFTFATSRGVTLSVQVEDTAISAPMAAMEVALPSGAVIYRGPLAKGTPLNVDLSVPTKDTQLKLKLKSDSQTLEAEVAIADARAVHTF